MNIRVNDIACAASSILTHLQDQGIETRQHHDFRFFSDCIKKLNGKGSSGQFSIEKYALRPNNSFWLEWLHNGRSIAVNALRFDDYGETDLATIWNMGQQQYAYGGGKMGEDHPTVASRMKGRVVYAGDFFLDPDFRGDRLPTSMVNYSFLLAEMAWKPDWIYGFMSSELVMQKGFNNRVGFMVNAPVGTDWINPPKDIRADDWLVALDRVSLDQNARVIARSGLSAMQQMQ